MHLDADDDLRAVAGCLEFFIAVASTDELGRLHLFLALRHSLLLGLAIPRAALPYDVRVELEKVCNGLEESFLHLAQSLRLSAPFRQLSLDDRYAFERQFLTLKFED